MRRLLGILIAFGLLAGQGLSVAAAVCRHHSVREHALARQSHDDRIASGALTEESAALVVAKKGALSGSDAASFLALADLPPEGSPWLHRRIVEAIAFPRADAPELIGRSIDPPLRPPLA